jgi:hypothetical protein
MGPTLRSTPLSPACGPRGALDAWRLDAGSHKLLRALKVGFVIARRSRRRRFRRGPRSIARTNPLPPGGSETGLVDLGLERLPLCPKALRNPRHQTGQSGLTDFAPSQLQRSGIWSAPGRTFELSSSHSSTARLSPSRRSGSKIPSSSPAFQPLSRKGQSPFRCLEGAAPNRFGQARDRPVIHFRPE